MKQLLVEIDDATAAELEHVAPARSRLRSEFIRTAIREALWRTEEDATRDAYERMPDGEPASFDRRTWESKARSRRAELKVL